MSNRLTPAVRSVTYRPDLDGIRGIAVLLVLVGHTFMVGTPMPSVTGVTLFFVLSGYLITNLLLTELEATGRISLRHFYERRVRRLLPALLAVVLVTSGLYAIRGDWPDFPRAALAATFYSANLALYAGVEMGVLFHTWSLSLEEQFYALWPLLLLLLVRVRRPLVVLVIAGIVLANELRVVLPDPATDLYSPVVRMDALLWGVLIALTPKVPARVTVVVAWVAIAVLSVLAWTAPAAMATSSVAAIAAAIVISGARPGWLSWRPLVRAGELSYGLYLWHYAAAMLLLPLTSAGNIAAMVVVWVFAFGAALVSERWIERRWRFPRASQPNPVGAVAVA